MKKNEDHNSRQQSLEDSAVNSDNIDSSSGSICSMK